MGNGWHCNGAARLGSCVYGERCECDCVPCGKERGLIDWTVSYCSDCYRTLADCVCGKKDEPMTQPEETTAALIARLHNELKAARKGIERLIGERDYHKKVQAEAQDGHAESVRMCRQVIQERDEQRARAEKAEEIAEVHAARCEGFERELAKVHKRAETLADALTERTRERDEAIKARDMTSMHREARNKRIAELEQAVANAQAEADRMGKLAETIGRQHEAQAILQGSQIADATKELDEAREQLAKLEWSAFRRPGCGGPLSVCCPSCQGMKPGHEVGSAFKRDEVGHRPTCWFAKKKANTPTVPEGHIYITPAGPPPNSPEPARPEPRFRVGEKVKDFTGQIWNIDGAEFRTNPLYGPAWWYFWNNGRNAWTKETALERVDKPAPKFAVGEWVTHGDKAGEIIERYAAEGSWIYKLSDAPAIGHWEQTIIAQTPQHKHDCKGSIFLGRHEGFDLWWRPTMREVVAVEPAVAHCYSVDGELLSRNPLAIEARRRAVARGLVK